MRQPTEFTLEQLTGRARDHVQEVPDPRCTLHTGVIAPFMAMRAAARLDGIDLVAFSGFRDFDRQLQIWNGKYLGQRPMQDREGRALDPLALAPADRVQAILWWSALPGASRHHWGTDFDVMDAKALGPGARFQVVPSEYQAGGPFERLTGWLDAHMHAYGFFRPYQVDRGGVAPEPWHLSYAPLAARAQAGFRVEELRRVLSAAAIEGREEVLSVLPETFTRYVVNVESPPETALLSPRFA